MADHPGKKTRRKPPAPARSAAGKTDPMLRNLKSFVVEEIEITDVRTTGPQRRHKSPPRWLPAVRLGAAILGLTLIAALAALVSRSAWPGDESRLLAIAWDMWAHGNLLVPRLNGAAAGTPPLFAWLVHLGWLAFGEVEWWPRLLPALFMLASLALIARMARLLWPGQAGVARGMPFVLLGGFFWVMSVAFLATGFLMVLCTLLALHALLWMWRKRDLRVWLLLGLALGIGLLAGGSLIVAYVLPVALFAPLWTRGTPVMPWTYWYADIAKALVMGGMIFALWAVPAARSGADAVKPLLFSPVAAHTLELFPATQPWWWYLLLLPALAFPWSLWPLPWLRLWHVRREPIGNGLAFCLLWAVLTIGLFSLLPVKQPQLLLPVVPAFFLASGWLLLDDRHATHDHSRLASTMIFPLMLLGGGLAVLPKLPRVDFLPELLWQQSPFVGVAIIGVGIAVGWLPLPDIRARIINMAVTVVAITAFGLLTLGWQFSDRYDIGAAAQAVAAAQRQGRPVGHVGPYSGQLHFAGRLHQPLEIVPPGQVEAWLAAHPDGLLVSYSRLWQPRPAAPCSAKCAPFYEQPYDDTRLQLWQAADLRGG
jgi:4-amino-4-deoxy-L-arabinose transferase-like glycosyltransferase